MHWWWWAELKYIDVTDISRLPIFWEQKHWNHISLK